MANLQALSEAALKSSKKHSKYVSNINYLIIILAISSIYTEKTLLLAASIAIAVFQIIVWVLSISAENKKTLGQSLIRHNIIEKGFQVNLSIKLSYLKSQLSIEERDDAIELEKDNYYSIPSDKSKIFLSILKESCFWTSNLYRGCLRSEVIQLGIILILFIVLCLLTISVHSVPDENFSIHRIILVLLGAFPLWMSIGNLMKYSNAANKLKIIDHELDANPDSFHELLILFTEYSVITSSSPLIPDELYKRYHQNIQADWDERSKGSIV